MPKTIQLKLSEDEAEILVDALEADMEGYVESAKEARGNNNRADVKTFSEAAQRIEALIAKIRELAAWLTLSAGKPTGSGPARGCPTERHRAERLFPLSVRSA